MKPPPELPDLLRAVLNETHTEYMTLQEAAVWFGVGRNKMAKIIKHIPDVQWSGSLFRIPTHRMPPAYVASRICAYLHNPSSESRNDQ